MDFSWFELIQVNILLVFVKSSTKLLLGKYISFLQIKRTYFKQLKYGFINLQIIISFNLIFFLFQKYFTIYISSKFKKYRAIVNIYVFSKYWIGYKLLFVINVYICMMLECVENILLSFSSQVQYFFMLFCTIYSTFTMSLNWVKYRSTINIKLSSLLLFFQQAIIFHHLREWQWRDLSAPLQLLFSLLW